MLLHASRIPNLVTVIVPFFNRERFLGQTVTSILQQDYPKIQLILVDDGSTDRSLRVAHSFSDPRIEVASCPRNRGKSQAVNSVLRRVRGEWVTVFDSDDLMTPGSLSRRIAFLKRHPKALAVMGCVISLIDERNRVLPSIHPLSAYLRGALSTLHRYVKVFGAVSAEFLIYGSCPLSPMCATLFRRQAIERIGKLNGRFDPLEDREYLARLAQIQRIPFLDFPVLRYRVHGDNLSGRAEKNRWTASPIAGPLYEELKRYFLRNTRQVYA